MYIFLCGVAFVSVWFILFRIIQPLAGIILIVLTWGSWVIVSSFVAGFTFRMLLMGRVSRIGFAHPVEPEADRFILSASAIITLLSLMIPLVFAYTGTSLTARGFIPLVLLWIYESATLLLYIIINILSNHGGFIEELVSPRSRRPVNIEGYKVFHGWRDISWFFNRSAGYYCRLKYLSALHMLFQGIEILARRTGERRLFYGKLYETLKQGYSVIKRRGLLRFVNKEILEKTLEDLSPERTWVVEADTEFFNNRPEPFKEYYRRLFSPLVNLYVKIKDLPEEASREGKQVLHTVYERLKEYVIHERLSEDEIKVIEGIIQELRNLMKKDHIDQSDLEKILGRTHLTINMIRNYLVHGQLTKNAIVYMGSRDLFDKLMSTPSILYALYTLIIAYIVDKYPELIRHKK